MIKKSKEQQIEQIIQYILNNKYKRVTQQEIADALGYSNSTFGHLFSQYFEMTYTRFMRKLRMRNVAKEMYGTYEKLDMIGERNGFKSKKFFVEFKKEFGITPREFQKTISIIPDMPMKKMMHKHPMDMEYKRIKTMVIRGYILPPEKMDPQWMFCAYPFLYRSSQIDLHKEHKQWGVWWHDKNNPENMVYVVGEPTKEYTELPENMQEIEIKGGNYAVFSVERGADYYDIVHTMRSLSWYVFRIWCPLNEKRMDDMGFIYEAFDQEKLYFYVPLVKGYGGIELEKDKSRIVEKIAGYVDEHVLEDMDVNQVIAHFGRSDFYCRDRFQICYKISLPEYMEKKRLYVLAQKMKQGKIRKEDLPDYHFSSEQAFRQAFYEAFQEKTENYRNIDMELINLDQYYMENFSRLTIEEKEIEDIYIAARIIKSGDDKNSLDLDIPGISSFWMENDFMDSGESLLDSGEGKIALYAGMKGKKADFETYHYVLGPVIREKEQENLSESFYPIRIKGGKYVVFSSGEQKDQGEALTDVLRMMMRCIDQVWIYDNWIRTDFQNRVSFFYYKEHKAYYYVPVYE